MADPAKAFFDSLTSYERIRELVDSGEAEGQYLECKAPGSPQLTRDLRASLAQAASGFANSGGGVFVWGVHTDKHPASSLDVLTEVVPLANARRFAQEVDRHLIRATRPQLALDPSRTLHDSQGASRGLVITYIPPTPGDPVQTTSDRKFYLRVGDEFHEMPYEVLQRMFLGAREPVLRAMFDGTRASFAEDGTWTLPIVITNDSTAAGRDV